MNKIILASLSPRRRELLRRITDNFEIMTPICDEITKGSPQIVALKNAQSKGYYLLEKAKQEDAIIIACDTVVSKDNIIFGKPKDKNHAKDILTTLSGDWHDVISGVFINADKQYYYTVNSKVYIKALTLTQIDRYIAEYSPFDKAGSYGIQDKTIVGDYRGDYENIVGLPLSRLRNILRENGIDVKK